MNNISNNYKFWKIIIVVLILSSIGFIVYKNIESRTVIGEYPFKKVTYYKHWVRFTPEENVTISDLVDMNSFHDFPAKIDFEHAMEKFGDPDNIREEKYSMYYEYFYGDARVEVAREEYSTGNEIAVSWATYSYPFEKLYTDVLSYDITRYVDPTSKNTSVVINDSKGDIIVLVMISGNRVTKMIRYR